MEQETKISSFRGFFGNHHHTIDVKNRAFVPAKFRDGLASGFMLTKGFETCLIGYSNEEWHKMMVNYSTAPKLETDCRDFIRGFSGNSHECEVDKQGRFSIPQYLQEYAKITKDFCFVGMIDHFEIWDSALWREENIKYDRSADVKAEKMQKYLKPLVVSAAAADGPAAV
ncbi:MAG: division/cell wall cluster transcriptional repressor MraZ [Oscillospiraceae bacterium]|nr:division/cell wall cluster transcriptional repressor MraZ [Oscillospiraceae bacterium]